MKIDTGFNVSMEKTEVPGLMGKVKDYKIINNLTAKREVEKYGRS